MLLGGCYLLPNSEQVSSNPNNGLCFASVCAEFPPNISPVGGSSIVVSEVPETPGANACFTATQPIRREAVSTQFPMGSLDA